MDETSLRAQFERAVAARPPTPYLVANSLRAGKKLRVRRRIETATASVGAVALVAILAPLLSAHLGSAGHEQTTGPGIVRSPGTAYVWTTINATTSTVTPIRLRTGTALKPMSFGGVVLNVAAAPDGKAVYVFSTPHNYAAAQVDYVTRINPATGKISRPIRLSGGLQEINIVDVAPGGRFAYAIEFGEWPGSKYATWAMIGINLATGAERKLVDPGQGFAITPNGRMAYAYDFQHDVVPVDLATGAALRPVKVPGTSMNVAITPDGRTAYVLSGSHGVGWLTPIDVATGASGKPIQMPAGPVGTQIAVAADGKTAFLSGGPSVIRINLARGKALSPIRLQSILGNYQYNLAMAPRAAIGYAVPLMKWVQPVNLQTGTAGSRLYLPSDYRTVTDPVLDLGGDAAYVGATAYSPGNVREDAVIPFQVSTQQFGKPIPVAGLPVKIVIAG
jgi:hypothetical protein